MTIPILARYLAAAALVLALAWLIVTRGLADLALRAGRPDPALALVPDLAEGLAAAAGHRLASGYPLQAVALSRAALARAPLSTPALRTLGLAAHVAGDRTLAARAMGQAAALGWRDAATQAWLVAAATNAGDPAGALVHFDALVRAHGLTPPVQDVLDDFARQRAGRPALLRRLMTSPPWRTAYFTDLAERGADTIVLRARLLRDLARSGVPVSPAELVGIEQALVTIGEPLAGYQLWQAVSGARPGTLYDPRFRHVEVDANHAVPFAWHLLPVVGATAAVETGGGEPALHLATDGRANGPLVRQFVALGAGAHRLTFHLRPGAEQAGGGFRVQLACLPAQLPYFGSARTNGGGGALDVYAALPPGRGCAVQSLEIWAGPTETGTAADISVDRVSLSAAVGGGVVSPLQQQQEESR